MDSKLFERIYRESNPLLSFKEIYFECNLEPLFERVFREADEENNEKFNFELKHAVSEYEKNQPFIDEFGNKIDPTDTLGKKFDTGPTKPPVPIKKPFSEYLENAKKQNNN